MILSDALFGTSELLGGSWESWPEKEKSWCCDHFSVPWKRGECRTTCKKLGHISNGWLEIVAIVTIVTIEGAERFDFGPGNPLKWDLWRIARNRTEWVSGQPVLQQG
jgi:hypothetical protein